MVVLWICVIRRLAGGEHLGRLKIVLDGLGLTGFDRERLGPGTGFAHRANRFGHLGLLDPAGGGHGNSQVVKRGHGHTSLNVFHPPVSRV